MGSIFGNKWNDLNENGIREANEAALVGWTIFLDQNRNGRLDTGETSTTTDANGNYSFTGLAAGTYTVAEVVQSGWKTTFPSGIAQSTLIPITDRRDLIFDPQRNRLYITTSDGDVERYDVTTQTLLTPFDVGNSLNGGDITPDGSALYIAENQTGATQAFIRKVNLNDGSVTNLTFNRTYDDTPSDVAIGANGIGMIRSFGQWHSIRQLDLATGAISSRGGSIYGGAQITRSADRSMFFTTQDGISSGPIFTYDAVGNQISPDIWTNSYLGSNLSAVNRNGSLIALEWGNGISIMDRNLNAVENLTNVDGGLAFDPLRDILYAASTTTDQVIAYDTSTWKELYRLNIGEDIYNTSSTPLGNGMMSVSNDGKYLFLSTASGVRMLDLVPPSTQTVNLSADGVATNINFGNQPIQPLTGSLSGTKWDDLNGNGLREANEQGLAGWTIFLDQNQNGLLDTGETSTTTDANGNYTFSGLATGTYTVAEVLPPTSKQTFPNAQSLLISITDRRDLIFDSQRNRLYITTSDGDVERYDVTTRTLLTPFDVGNSLNGGDITPDGSALYIADNQRGATQAFIRKVNLNDGSVTNLTFNLTYDDTPSDVAIGANGIGMIRSFGQWHQIRQLDLATGAISSRSDGGSIYGGAQITRSADRSMFFMTQDGISSGPIFTYDAVSNQFSQEIWTNSYLGSNLSAVNRNGSLIALEWGYGISIMDRNLNAVENLADADGGLAFDPLRDILYAASTTTDQVIAYDTSTWKELYRLNIGEDIQNNYDTSSTPLGNGMMSVSNDGKYLFLSTASGVRMLTLLDPVTPNPLSSVGTHTVTLTAGQNLTGFNFGSQQTLFSINNVTLIEGETGTPNAVFTVSLNAASSQTVSVNYATADKTATAGLDYTATSGQLIFAPGETTKTISVSILNDYRHEPDETFTVNLSNPSNGAIANNQGVGTIKNDDKPLRGFDFNNDGKADILWRNRVTGQNAVWQMNGTDIAQGIFLTPVTDPNWSIGGTGDFNSDGQIDILWRNTATGQNAVWQMNGTDIAQGIFLTPVTDLNWGIGGTGDFNSDGQIDILWRNTATEQNAVWQMNGTNVAQGIFLTPVTDLNWGMGGTGDFNSDGQIDILWRNTATGQNVAWLMNGTNIAQSIFLTPVTDLNWGMGGTGDFNNDGQTDILWRNTATGQNVAWLMNGTNIAQGIFLTPVTDLNWQMVV